MMSILVRQRVGSVVLGLSALTLGWAADTDRAATGKAISPSTMQKSSATKGGSARGPLPDPGLLDGSAQPAEKRPDYGMVGDFELPGDENARNGRVGGPPQPPGQQQGNGAGIPGPSAGLPIPSLPSGGGAAPGSPIPQIPNPLAQQGQGAGGGPENPAAAGKQAEGAGQQGAGPQGQQVGQLTGEGGGPEQGEIGNKPQQVSIGDSAMQIKTVANPATVVGGQQAGQTQQHEKTPGTGGKGPSGSNSNKGVERGRTMPAGL